MLFTLTVKPLFAQVVSDFSVDVEDWNTYGDFGGSGPGEPEYQSTGGNPGGCIKQTDGSTGVWYWYGPAKFRGDLSDYYDCELKFDLKQNQIVFPVTEYDVMFFNNSGDTMVFNIVDPDSLNTWESYAVPLKVGVGWKYGSSIGGGAPVITAAQLSAILSDVKRIRIRAEYTGLGYETDYLDNVILTCTDLALPVELSQFSATEVGIHTAKLSWSTHSELNNAGFQVEKSINGSDFDSIGFVEGNGTSTFSHDYLFYDENFVYTSYYRLKQLDFTGKTGYSNIVSLENKHPNQSVISLFPNPAINTITLSSIGSDPLISFEIKDITGRILFRKEAETNAGVYNTTIPIQFLDAGIYFLTCYKLGGRETHKFEKVR
ncbi:MAG: T9SS type A sorting domain-containing protein [Bacteroidetes bacterium]|nr:T9SS type A sorting domain-containing protein [Bacteroidota bacterium]